MLTLEAALFLCASRVLIELVKFRRWSRTLGKPAQRAEDAPDLEPGTHYLSRVVERASRKLPIHFKCLPRAMATHWMLRRRGVPSTLTLAVLPGQARGTLDDLHAWVEVGDSIVIGASDQPHHVVARFT